MSGSAKPDRAAWPLLLLVVACTKHPAKTNPPATSAPFASPSVPPSTLAVLTMAPPHTAASGSSALPAHSFDAGANACRLVFGPVQEPFVGDATLVLGDTGVLVVAQQRGVPTITAVPPGNVPAPSVTDAGLSRATSPACEVLGGSSFCMDPFGMIHRRPMASEGGDVVVAHGRPGTPFAAELLDQSHTVVAYLADQRTTEGMVSVAYASVNGGPPVRLSDEGSGTTHVALARRGPSIVALLLDGRVAMTPVHARSLTMVDERLQVGEDVVVFVGGGAEASTRGALATTASGSMYALLPIAGEAGFGLAGIRLGDPPQIDEPTSWSAYPNGLDPAPVVATRGVTPIRVARVRPLEARPDAPRGLELGRLDDEGAFVPYGLVASKGRVSGVSITVDHAGFLWVLFTDGAGTWLEKRACP